MAVQQAPDPAVEPAPHRQCGRCRAIFPGDAELDAAEATDWWLCPPCRAALFGR